MNPAVDTRAHDARAAALLIARMERAPFSAWHRRARIVMGSATFFDAYNALSLAFALPILVRLWHITPAQSGLLIGSSYVGQLAGALIFGWIAERYGRVFSAASAVALMSVMSLACVFAGSFNALFAYRLIQGVGVGGEMPVAAAYINELSRARGRGSFFLLYEMIFPLGLMATGQIGAWLVPVIGWKIMFLLGGIPGLLIAVLVWRLPESPRWLLTKGRTNKAEAIVKQMEAVQRHPLPPVAEPTPAAIQAATSSRAPYSAVLSASYRSRTLLVWSLWAFSYFVTNGLNNWMPTLYNTVYHLGLKQSLRAASLTNVAQVLLLFVCARLIDRTGRRYWNLAAFVAGGILLAILGFTGAKSVLSVIVLATAGYGIIGTANAVLYLYTPEIYPTSMRAMGTGMATAWLRLASAIAPSIVGVLVASRGVPTVLWMFAGVSFAGAIASLGMIETRGRPLEEIAAL